MGTIVENLEEFITDVSHEVSYVKVNLVNSPYISLSNSLFFLEYTKWSHRTTPGIDPRKWKTEQRNKHIEVFQYRWSLVRQRYNREFETANHYFTRRKIQCDAIIPELNDMHWKFGERIKHLSNWRSRRRFKKCIQKSEYTWYRVCVSRVPAECNILIN